MRWSQEQAQAHQKRVRASQWLNLSRIAPMNVTTVVATPKKPSKYKNVPTVVDGHRFDSRKEAERYSELKLEEKAGVIRKLRLQPRYPLTVAGIVVGFYVSDFVYEELEGANMASVWREITEDCKGMRTPVYKLKKKIFEAQYGVEIRET